MRSEAVSQWGLNRNQLAAFVACTRWSVLCTIEDRVERGTEANFEIYREYLQRLGYLKGSGHLIAPARSSSAGRTASEIRGIVAEAITKHPDLAEALFSEKPGQIVKTYGNRLVGLDKPQIRLLQALALHERALDSLDHQRLVSQFPFPVDAVNFFGRFLAGGCCAPDEAFRHLVLSQPWFQIIRNVIEGVSNERKSWLFLKSAGVELHIDADLEEQGQIRNQQAEFLENLRRYILPAVANSRDMGETTAVKNRPRLAVVTVPRLPEPPETIYSRPAERQAFSLQFLNWLMLGGEPGPLLTRTALPFAEEERIARTREVIPTMRTDLADLGRRRSGLPKDSKESITLDSKIRQLNSKLERAEIRVQRFDERALRTDSVVDFLKKQMGYGFPDLRFRAAIAVARTSGAKIVFDLLDRGERNGFLAALDYAYAAKTSRYPVCALIRQSAFLFSEHHRDVLDRYQAPGASASGQQFRSLQIDPDDLNPSARLVLEQLELKRTNSTLGNFAAFLLEELEPSGVSNRTELLYLAGKALAINRPTMVDVLHYVLDRQSSLSESEALALLDGLPSFGIRKLPAETVTLCIERFGLPAHLFTRYHDYVERYHPNKVGDLPYQLEDLGRFEAAFEFDLDTCGVTGEVEELEQLLIKHNIVGIRDDTAYGTDDEMLAGDEEDKHPGKESTEAERPYTTPVQRVVRGFVRRIVSAECDESLRNHSVVALKKPTNQGNFLSVLFGFLSGAESAETVNFGRVARLLDQLAIHDRNTVFVVDAKKLTDPRHYRQFLDLAEKRGIKLVLQNLPSSLPGIPIVTVRPFIDSDIGSRLERDSKWISKCLNSDKPMDASRYDIAAQHVSRLRQRGDDPLNLVVQVIDGAVQIARRAGHPLPEARHIVEATAPVFNLLSPQDAIYTVGLIERFVAEAKIELLGQDQAIDEFGSVVSDHLLGLGDPTRCLAIMMPGPTGLGKTQLMQLLQLLTNMPGLYLDGSDYHSEHSATALFGSPRSYKGSTVGPLFAFGRKHRGRGFVFIDELEKAHETVHGGLLNTFDKGRIPSGTGRALRCPSLMFMCATNAGADEMHSGMSKAEIRKILAERFKGPDGRPRPEFVNRFTVIPMLSISHGAFMGVIEKRLHDMGQRFGFMRANLDLARVEPAAGRIIFEHVRQECETAEAMRKAKQKTMGFGMGVMPPLSLETDTFFNMRAVGRAVEQLSGSSLRKFVKEQLMLMAASADVPQRSLILDADGPKRLLFSDSRVAV